MWLERRGRKLVQGQEGGGGVGIETTRRAPFTPTTPPSHLFPSHLSCTSFLPPPLKRGPVHPCAQRFQMGCSALVPIRPPRFEGYRLHCLCTAGKLARLPPLPLKPLSCGRMKPPKPNQRSDRKRHVVVAPGVENTASRFRFANSDRATAVPCPGRVSTWPTVGYVAAVA